MAGPLQILLSRVEETWLSKLYTFSRNHFQGINIPSHDHTHHYRVWVYAKTIILNLATKDIDITESFLQQLIVAVFFHDTGMKSTLSADHGSVSSDLCKQFLVLHPFDDMVEAEPVLEAIKNHEDKSYSNLGKTDQLLLSILNLADDLDAFGNVGVYRYAEINLLRGNHLEEIPDRILTNIDRRYAHLLARLEAGAPQFLLQCEKRYLITHEFYLQASSNGTEGRGISPLVARAVLHQIKDLVINEHVHPTHIADTGPMEYKAQHEWWLNFNNEWNLFQYPNYE